MSGYTGVPCLIILVSMSGYTGVLCYTGVPCYTGMPCLVIWCSMSGYTGVPCLVILVFHVWLYWCSMSDYTGVHVILVFHVWLYWCSCLVILVFHVILYWCSMHTHSWLSWVDEDDDEVGLKEKPEDTSKILNRNKIWSTGSVDEGLDPKLLPLLGLRTRKTAGASGLRVRRRGGGWNVLAGGRLQPGLKLWFPPDPRRRCPKFLNLNWRKGHCYHYKIS